MKKPKFYIKDLPDGMNIKNPHALIATWFGAGLLRPAPGTIGTFAGLPIGYLIAYTLGPIALIIATVALMVIGTIAADKYGKKSGQVDDQSIVVDEVVGVWIAALPAYSNIYLWILAFFLFRLFDIWKPWPASFFDKDSKNGFYVMMDDVVAGIYALFGVSMVTLAMLA